MIFLYMTGQVQSRESCRFAAQMKRAPLCQDKEAGTHILKTFDRFGHIHVLVMHEPPGVVGGGCHEGIINLWILPAEFSEPFEIA